MSWGLVLFSVFICIAGNVFAKTHVKDGDKASTVVQTYTYGFENHPIESGVWRSLGNTRLTWNASGGYNNKSVVIMDAASQDERVRLETVSGIPVQPGERYRVKGWIRQDASPTGIVSIGVRWTDGESSLGERLSPGAWNGEWILSEMIVTVPKKATEMHIQCRADGATGKAFFDGVIVEKLEKNGVWTSVDVGGNKKQFRPDEIPALSVVLENPSYDHRDIQVQIHVEDYADREVYAVTKEVQLDSKSNKEIEVRFEALLGKQGYYNIYIYTVESGEMLDRLREELIVFPQDNIAGSEWLVDNPVAVNVYVWSEASFYGTTEEEIRAYVGKLRQMGVQTLRFWIRTGFEKWIPHQRDFMKIAKEHDMEILLVVGLLSAAAENARELAFWDGVSYYFEFLEELLPEYEGLIDVVEIWNEPFPTPLYFEVLREGYNKVKAFDSDLRVMHAGFYWWHRGSQKYPEKERFEYFSHGTAFNDLASLNHFYTEGYNFHEYYSEAPERPYIKDLGVHRNIMNRYGVGSYGESLWQTETSWESAVQRPYYGYQGDPEIRMFSYRQQADYATRLFLITLSESYRDFDLRNFWYLPYDQHFFRYVPWYTTGIFERNGMPKPSYLMVVNMVNTLANSKYVGRLEIQKKVLGLGIGLDEDIWSLVFRDGKEPIVAIWSARGKTKVDLDVYSSKVVIIDPMGNRQEIEVKDNTISLTVDESPIYILGGGEELVWEALNAQLKRVNSEGMELLAANSALRKKFSDIAKLSETAVKDKHSERLKTAVREVYDIVDDLLNQAQAGKISAQDACVYLSILRTADVLEDAIMLGGTVEDAEGLQESFEDAYLQHEALSRKTDPLVGVSKTKTLMRLSERRLEQALRNMELHRYDEVDMLLGQVKRLHSIVESLLELEPQYKLDVWMKANEYLIRAGVGDSTTVSITVSNETEESVVVKMNLQTPPGVSVKTDKSDIVLSPGSALEIPLVITVQQGLSATQEIRVMGSVGDQLLAPIAIGIQQK